MEEFKSTENTLAAWTINKAGSRRLALSVFFATLAIFIISLVSIYFIFKSTHIAVLAVPLILFLPMLAAFKGFLRVLSVYKEDTQVYVTDRGIYVRYLEQKDKYAFKDWYLIKEYDVVSFPSKSFFDKLIEVPTRFVLKGDTAEENLFVDALGPDAENFRSLLHERNIPFGFKIE